MEARVVWKTGWNGDGELVVEVKAAADRTVGTWMRFIRTLHSPSFGPGWVLTL